MQQASISQLRGGGSIQRLSTTNFSNFSLDLYLVDQVTRVRPALQVVPAIPGTRASRPRPPLPPVPALPADRALRVHRADLSSPATPTSRLQSELIPKGRALNQTRRNDCSSRNVLCTSPVVLVPLALLPLRVVPMGPVDRSVPQGRAVRPLHRNQQDLEDLEFTEQSKSFLNSN